MPGRENNPERRRAHKVARAKTLRKRLTRAEALLWSRLRTKQLGPRFRRQQPIGPYIVDFYCAEAKLAVEVDGGQHGVPAGEARDAARTRWLEDEGYLVLRFWNNEVVENLEGVLTRIADELQAAAVTGATPPPAPSPGGGK